MVGTLNREITPSYFQIFRQIAKDIHQLQALAIFDPQPDKLLLRKIREPFPQSLKPQFRPETPYASRDPPCIIIQRRLVRKTDYMVSIRFAEAFQIQLLPANDRFQNLTDQCLFLTGKRSQRGHHLPAPPQQSFLPIISDAFCQFLREFPSFSPYLLGKIFQKSDPLLGRDCRGVRDRITGAS